ncbi:MAG: alpha-glucan family phosphorylase, partial [Planctomycetota bacterium]
DVCHLNEGHAAFVALERIRRLIEDHDLSFDEARQQAAASHCFTTHTPVPAGIDRFPADMIKAYFKDFHPSLKLDMEGLLALGRDDVFNKKEPFSMATLAIRTADWCNGVSQLHGEVSRGMWQGIWPGVPEQEIPIGAVTNGVHASTWLIPEIADALDAHTAPGHRRQHPEDFDAFKAIHHVPDEDLWTIHEKYRQRLVDFASKTNPFRPERLGPSYRAPKGLDPHALTIGFARRFATYKRGNLLLRDPQRLLNLLNHPEHPVQFVIAGKAHPADHQGKELIQQLVRFADDHGVGHRLVFLENYDMQVARYLVQGSDVWLNNPRRGMEASGTSGMKAAMNGIPNCSILDGWWDEAYTPHVGWAIGHREDYDDPNTADHYESRALYDLLENHIAPEFYARDTTGIPRQWVHRMKQSIAELGPFFNTNRMVAEYTQDYYLPAVDRAHRLAADRFKPAVTLAGEKARLRYAWPSVHITDVALAWDSVPADQPLPVTVTVETGGLPDDALLAEACYGTVSPTGQITDFHARQLERDLVASTPDLAVFKGELHAHHPGRQGLCVRVVPAADLPSPIHEPGLIRWFGQAKPTPPTKEEPAKEAAATA